MECRLSIDLVSIETVSIKSINQHLTADALIVRNHDPI